MPDDGINVQYFPQQDKLFHFVFYLVMTMLLRNLYPNNQNKFHWGPIFLASFYGFIMECIQGTSIQGRYFDYFDIIANIIGSLTGSYIIYLLRKKDHYG